MKTRSQTKLENSNKEYVVDIDFDGAHDAWMANKVRIGESYRYVCQKQGLRNCKCISTCLPGEDYCRTHLKMIKKMETRSEKKLQEFIKNEI